MVPRALPSQPHACDCRRDHLSGAAAMSDAPLFAHLALLAIVPFSWFAFRSRPTLTASLWVFFGSVLFAPEHAYFKLPALPPFTKQTIPLVCVLVAVWFRSPEVVRAARPFRGLDLLALLPVATALATAATNTDPLQFGVVSRTFCQAMSITDGIALGLTFAFNIWLPFFIGRMLIRSGRDLRTLLTTLATFGVVYTPFMLYEMRFSPQLHRMLYGYMAHPDFLQTVRWGGYRPMVFMEHGLAVALFAFVAWSAALVMTRDGAVKITWWRARWVTFGLAAMVVFSKSTGVIGYMLICLIPLYRLKPRALLRFAAAGSTLVMLYPALRATDLFPTMELYDFFAQNVSQDRADSLLFRFTNEDMLLDRARERVLWGWGYFGRNLVYERMTGEMISVTDGYWIIIFGMSGAVAFVAAFGTLLTPVYSALGRLKKLPQRDHLLTASLALIVSVVVIDLVPNGLYSVYPYFLSGALWGYTSHAVR